MIEQPTNQIVDNLKAAVIRRFPKVKVIEVETEKLVENPSIYFYVESDSLLLELTLKGSFQFEIVKIEANDSQPTLQYLNEYLKSFRKFSLAYEKQLTIRAQADSHGKSFTITEYIDQHRSHLAHIACDADELINYLFVEIIK